MGNRFFYIPIFFNAGWQLQIQFLVSINYIHQLLTYHDIFRFRIDKSITFPAYYPPVSRAAAMLSSYPLKKPYREEPVERTIGKNVLITGAASGLGKALAHAFARQKVNLALFDENRRALEDVERETSVYRTRVYGYRCDLGDVRDIDRTIKIMRGHFDSIDIIVITPPASQEKAFVASTAEDAAGTIQKTLVGPIRLTQHFIETMVRGNSGHLVHIVTPAACGGMPGKVIFSAAETGFAGYSGALRKELARAGMAGVKITDVILRAGGDKNLEAAAERIVSAVRHDKRKIVIPFSLRMEMLFK